ncbi:hypothetical protein Tco_0139484 [Tanacetum coccineum]
MTYMTLYETEEVSSDEDVDEWLNEELSKRMTGQDKEEEENALIDILKTVVEECKSIYKKAQIRTPSSRTSVIQEVSFVAEEEEVDRDRINMMPKSLFEHLKLANLKKTSMVIEIVIDTLEEPNETILLGRPFLATIHAQIDVFRGEILLGVGNEKKSKYSNPQEMEKYDSPALEQEPITTARRSVGHYHERQNVRGNGMKFDDFLKVRYGNKNIDDVIRERRYYEWVAQN